MRKRLSPASKEIETHHSQVLVEECWRSQTKTSMANNMSKLELENEELKQRISNLEQIIRRKDEKNDNDDGIIVDKEVVCEASSSFDHNRDNANLCYAIMDRGIWLVGLLIMQSCSGFVLSRNEQLLKRHPVIIFFLTMLVGAGGNAGNQASVRGALLGCRNID